MGQSFYFPEVSLLKRCEPIDDAPGPAFDALLKKHKINRAEYQKIIEIMGRTPTIAELGVFSAMWSEHCSYKSSRAHLGRFPTEGPDVVVGPGENAGVVRVSGKLCLAFKMESHNHPSYIEPYQGAATGVGGILRDVFCMGSRPIANLNALRFGERTHPRTPYLVERVVKGIGDYGNCVGVPTVGGNISFDPSYNGNCLVNAMTVGVIHEDRIFKGYASGEGNIVVYVGSATGRDGIHGASMASDSFSSQESSERSTIQVGDPFTEKLLIEATLEVLEKDLVVGLQDMGAAGLTSSSFEMAGRAGNGLFLDLDHVPVRTSAMTAYELLLSESQERMLMVIKPENFEKLKAVLDKWGLHGTVIGKVTTTGRVEIHYQGRLEADMPVGPLADNAPKYERPITPRLRARDPSFDDTVTQAIEAQGPEAVFCAILKDSGDKRPIYHQYDHHIGRKTVRGPQAQGAAVLWMRSEWADPSLPYLGVLATAACNERYTRIDPRVGAAHAVLKCAHMIAAAGGKPLAITDCLNYGNPEDPEVMWEFSEGVDGISDACRELGVPVVSGNVSLYNQTDGVSIAPTPMIGMVGKMDDIRQAPAAVLSQPGPIFLLQARGAKPGFGGSSAARLLGCNPLGGEIPTIDWQAEREAMDFLRRVITQGLVSASRDVGDGGLIVTAAKMVLAAGLTLELDPSKADFSVENELLRGFGELSGAYLLAFKDESIAAALQEAMSLRYNTLVPIGEASQPSQQGGGIMWGRTGHVPLDKAQEMFLTSLKLS